MNSMNINSIDILVFFSWLFVCFSCCFCSFGQISLNCDARTSKDTSQSWHMWQLKLAWIEINDVFFWSESTWQLMVFIQFNGFCHSKSHCGSTASTIGRIARARRPVSWLWRVSTLEGVASNLHLIMASGRWLPIELRLHQLYAAGVIVREWTNYASGPTWTRILSLRLITLADPENSTRKITFHNVVTIRNPFNDATMLV